MAENVTVEIQIPEEAILFRLPPGLNRRLQELLDKQDSGEALSPDEREEAEGLVDVAEMLSLLRLKVERAQQQA